MRKREENKKRYGKTIYSQESCDELDASTPSIHDRQHHLDSLIVRHRLAAFVLEYVLVHSCALDMSILQCKGSDVVMACRFAVGSGRHV